MLTARQLHARATEANASGRFRQARRLFLLALDRTSDPSLTAALNRGLGYAQTELGDAREGLSLLTRTITGAEALSEQELGMLLSQRGLIRIRLGDPKGALSDYQLAEPMLRDEPAELARIGINRGNIFLDQAIVESAIVDFTMAAQQYRLLGNTIGEAKAIGNLGYAYMLAGDLVRALRLINESAVMLERESPALLPVADQDLAEALVAAGRPEEALRLLRRAAAQFGARRQRLRQAGAELTLAQLLAWEDPGRAIRLARSATTRFERAGLRGRRCGALRCAPPAHSASASPMLPRPSGFLPNASGSACVATHSPCACC